MEDEITAARMLSLDGDWKCQPDWNDPSIDNLLPNLFGRDEWIAATVPGTIHTDLMRAGKIPDPFRDDNENKVQWVGNLAWRYVRRFALPDDFLSSNEIELCAEGLDTFAHIRINGAEVGQTDNMFIPHSFEVKSALRRGENEIEIVFDSPLERSQALEQRHGRLMAALNSSRVYARKAQYSFGWDWGPVLPTSGVWRPIYLIAHAKVRLLKFSIESHLDTSLKRARITITIESRVLAKSVEWKAQLQGHGFLQSIQRSEASPAQSFTFEIENPRLWWPNGLGEPALYELRLQARCDGEEQFTISRKIGLRRVELVTEPEAGGESFRLRINNVPVFCKGADWIPADSFVPRITTEKYRALLAMARDANMNMVRVWGGGIYEQPAFYDLCDELGLMVWQDFMFACANYPDHEEFANNVRREVRTVVRQLRPHPCIVLWCGNNENEWIWHLTTGRPYSEMPGVKIFDTIIPEILASEDPSRPYRQSTPFGGDDPNSEELGNRHQWEMWSRWASPSTVKRDRSRFVTEFGFQAPANLETWRESISPQHRWPQSPVMEHHNKQVEGTERMYRFIAEQLRVPSNFDEFVYRGQIMQAEALKLCVEHWRRRKFMTAGALFWQLNDCWPVTSWSAIDSALRPKASYWYARRFYAPVLVTFRESGGYLEVFAVNDTLQNLHCDFELASLSLDGEVLEKRRMRTLIPANASVKLSAHSSHNMKVSDPSRQYLRASLLDGDRPLAVNRYFFVPLKHLELETPEIDTSILRVTEGQYRLKISSEHFVKSLGLVLPDRAQISDNCFDVDGGEAISLEVRMPEGSAALSHREIGIQHI